MGSAKDPENTSRHLAQLLDGLPVTDRRLDVAGISTPVLEGGTGVPIILLHGMGGFAEEWACAVPKLVSSHRVVAPDLPGLGRSRLGNATLDATSVVEWLRVLIDKTCDEPPALVDHSLGGGIAARFAIAHPDKVRCVVLEGSSSLCRFRPAPGSVVAIVRFGMPPTRANHERFLRQVLFDPDRARAEWGDRWPASQEYDIELAGNKAVSKATGQLVRRIVARKIPQEQLGSITVPVALIWGTGDRLMRFAIGERVAKAFDWPLYPIEECGHAPTSNAPVSSSSRLRRLSPPRAGLGYDRGALVDRTSQGERTPAQVVREGSAQVRREIGLDRTLALRRANRGWACSRARGDTLEVAIGTGLNLPNYQRGVRLTGIDLTPEMLVLARFPAGDVGMPVTL